MRVDHNKYALFKYEHNTLGKNNAPNIVMLGDVVINKDNEIGVIIQTHGNDEYRTDMFGNCSISEIRIADYVDIQKYRPELITENQK